jgi:SWI/SNF-related matrix-associated actin-dependent regulator of chromatin subfamily A member 5
MPRLLKGEDVQGDVFPPTARKCRLPKNVSAHVTDEPNHMLSGQKRLRMDRPFATDGSPHASTYRGSASLSVTPKFPTGELPKASGAAVSANNSKVAHVIQQKPDNLESLSISSNLCVASFSRHVDLLEPFIERSVVTIMRSIPVEEQTNSLEEVPQPSSICGNMRPYQILGLNWLIQQHKKSIGSILADEMGLGKTVQTISFIAHLLQTQKQSNLHLIVVPLSVLSNWENEFKKFCPSIRVKRIHVYSGNEASKIFMQMQSSCCPYDVIITTYEVIRSKFWSYRLSRILWHSLVLDEGHRIKNELTDAAHTCSLLRARFRLILTGTPVQNNMHESWALLNFLNPRVFTVSKTFDETFQSSSRNPNGVQSSPELMSKCHQIFRLIVLRRLKSEVELTLPAKLETLINCPLSDMQVFFTQRLLLQSSSVMKRMEESRVNGQTAGDDMRKLQSLAMQLRKAANHPYLFDGAENPELNGITTEEIITSSGKMVWLDALLTQLLSKGHRIVVFSQFTRILDIICDYLNLKSIRHCRLDGQTNPVLRQVIIDQFNRLGSRENVFVASTRAGGEGINLQSADTVILYDSDWYMTSKIFHHISIRQTRNSNIFQESSKRHSSNRPCTSHWPTKHRPHLQTRDCWLS